jgi:hypothetical protein
MNVPEPSSKDIVAELRTPRAVRERCHAVLARAHHGDTRHFFVDETAIPHVSELVVDVIKTAYPSLVVPVHGRYRHFEVGGVARMRELDDRLASVRDPKERAKAKIDLVVTSVLLDAGAGSAWAYEENGHRHARSEGLAVASFRAFMSGAFSAAGDLRADASGLASLDPARFRACFQVRADNPLVGVEGRVGLMHALGKAIADRPDVFGKEGRIGGLLDALRPDSNGEVSASSLLGLLLDALESIWPGRVVLDGHNLGDTWTYQSTLVPFHKLSQWLSYSLVEPIAEAGIAIVGLGELTGLPEYRNGGLLIDTGAIVPKDPSALAKTHAVGDELVVEWRALTVALLDEVAREVRSRLRKSEGEFPLARVLEGGTWAAGRRIAAEKRPGGVPPLTIDSDGTVF